MKSLLLASLGILGVAAMSTPSYAADGCGRGWFWNGYRCAPRYAPPPHRVYREYDSGPRFRVYRDHGPRREYSYGPRGGGWPTWNGCPHNYTVQDGECKPYRGY